MLKAFAVSLLLAAGAASAAPPPASIAITRPQADLDRDSSRKPFDLIKFAGVRRGMTIVDFWPGSGYWSRLFAAAVGPKGKVFAFVPKEIEQFHGDPLGSAKAMAAEPGMGVVTVEDGPIARQPTDHDFADIVWTFENYHDLHNGTMAADLAAFDKAIYRILKPGGVFVIVDHAAAPGSAARDTSTLHRIDPALVRSELEAAGFKYDGESRILANPADPHTAKVFDPALRGSTDRFAFRFRKPR
jgi:predicted methyltransferase